jgi:hypothetical protein
MALGLSLPGLIQTAEQIISFDFLVACPWEKLYLVGNITQASFADRVSCGLFLERLHLLGNINLAIFAGRLSFGVFPKRIFTFSANHAIPAARRLINKPFQGK